MAINWTITKNTATNTMRFLCTGAVALDLNQLQIGDYVNVYGAAWNANNKGSFEITNVEVYYVVGVLNQAFEFINPDGVAETPTQTLAEELQFFRPVINTIQNSNGRTVVVSSTEDKNLQVIIPATTQAVSRTEKTASYLHTNSAVEITRINRDKNGEVTLFYDGSPSPAFATGQFIYLDLVNPTPSEAFKSIGVPGTFNAIGTTDAATVDLISLLQTNTTDVGRTNFDMIKAANGDGLIVGGSTLVAGTPTLTGNIGRYRPTSSAVVSDATLADGSTRYSYQWQANGATTNNTELNRTALITTGPANGQVMINGGATLTLGNWSTTVGLIGSSRKYDPVANATAASGTDPQAFVGHTLTTLRDGRIVSYGGAESTSTGLLNGRNSTLGYIWNPATQAWPSPGFANFFSAYPRAHHTATELADGKVMFIGGLAGAQEFEINSQTLAYWRCNETGGGFIGDASGNAYSLTTSGVTAAVLGAKILNGREFTQAAAHAAGAGDAAAVTALLGEWTVEWWSCGATGVYPGTMALSGLGSGTIVAYGTVGSELQADNTLMHVGINAGNLFFRWENGAGVDVTGSVAITGHVVDHYNHFAVRKKLNGATYDVSLFVNGRQIGATFTGLANANGGGNSQWYMARDPDGATGFSGVIDDVVVMKYARSDEDILLDYWKGSPSVPTKAGNRSHRIGRCLETCEIWNPAAAVATAASMSVGRAYHTATLLPDGRVFVMGGLSHNLTNFAKALYDAGPTSLNGCSVSTNSSEIYDPATGQWTQGPQFSVRRHNHTAIYVPSRQQVFIIGGESTQGDDVKVIEVMDVKTMRVSSFNEKLTHKAYKAILLSDTTILVGTNDTTGAPPVYTNVHQLIQLESPSLSSKQLSDYHKITSTGSGFFKIQTPGAKLYYSNYGKPNKADIPSYTVNNGVRTSNVTTLTFAAGHPFVVGQDVYVSLNNTVLFSSGRKIITAITATTISYAEVAADQGSTAITGEVFKNYAPDANATSWSAQAGSIAGPYILDPIEGVAISSIKTTIGGSLFTGIYEGQMYTVLPVVNASVFPDEEGYVVVGFGTKLQTQPIKYFGRYNAEGLLIDYRYKFLNDIPSGTEVVQLTQRDPYVPTEAIGQFYITASAAGRIAAEKTVNDIAAAGVDVDVTVVYPGDRGLGAEGHASNGNTKLSDKVIVWGGDDLDNEIKKLKE